MGVSGVICESSKGVKEVCQGCCMGVSRVLESSHKGVKGRYTGISWVLQKSYKNVTRVFHWSDMSRVTSQE